VKVKSNISFSSDFHMVNSKHLEHKLWPTSADEYLAAGSVVCTS
jgi:hypothetical protein